MMDNDGTPLATKAETIGYNDIWSTKDDTPRVSLNKAYAENSNYREVQDEPKKQSFAERMKSGMQKQVNRAKESLKQTYATTKEEAKKKITYENIKKGALTVGRNVEHNLKEDAGNLKEDVRESYKKNKPKVEKVVRENVTRKNIMNVFENNKRFLESESTGFNGPRFEDMMSMLTRNSKKKQTKYTGPTFEDLYLQPMKPVRTKRKHSKSTKPLNKNKNNSNAIIKNIRSMF